MSKALDEAIENLTNTYQALAVAAVGYRETLDAKEIAEALAKASPDTAEFIALSHLNELFKQTSIEVADAPVSVKVVDITESEE